MLIRIDSYLSNYGICSRRKVKDLIKGGRVAVNDHLLTSVERIDPEKDDILVDGKPVKRKVDAYEYKILNKPLNVLSTTFDDFGRSTVMDYVKSKARLYPVGRLDVNSTGLILLTNDGDLSLKMTHPRYHVSKKYLVTVDKEITKEDVVKLESGIKIYGKKTLPAHVKRLTKNQFEIELRQGLKRQIRIMCKVIGLNVTSLHRVAIGPLNIGNLKVGETRDLNSDELKKLFASLKTN